MARTKNSIIGYFVKNISVVLGIVLIWRGIWIILDKVDYALFGGDHIFTAVTGVIIGILILYIPDRDLKELGNL